MPSLHGNIVNIGLPPRGLLSLVFEAGTESSGEQNIDRICVALDRIMGVNVYSVKRGGLEEGGSSSGVGGGMHAVFVQKVFRLGEPLT